jgi:hypothetical protein
MTMWMTTSSDCNYGSVFSYMATDRSEIINAKTLYIFLHIYRVNTYAVTADSCKDFNWRLAEYTLHTLLLCQFIKY